MKTLKALLFFGATLVMAIYLFEITNLDLMIQDCFFNFETSKWIIDKRDPLLKLIFYSGPKKMIIAGGGVILVFYVFSWKKKRRAKHRRAFLHILLALVVVPLVIASLKQVTNMYCPAQMDLYDGSHPYIKLFEPYPEGTAPCKPGKCFPAGHASAGFALMILWYALRSKRKKWIGLVSGIAAGWTMGLYQMMKGAHFMSHTVVTMISAWILILVIHAVADRVHPD